MTSKPDSILPGFGLGIATFFTIMALPWDNAPLFWLAMAGLCGLTLLQTIIAAKSGNLLGLFSLAIASVIVLSAVSEFGATKAGLDPASHPLAFGLFLFVIVGFPLGVLAFSYPFMPPLQAFLAGLCGVIYLPLPLWILIELGLSDTMIDVFDRRFQLGHLLGLDRINMMLLGDILGMCLASGFTLLILSLPALPVVLIAHAWLGRS